MNASLAMNTSFSALGVNIPGIQSIKQRAGASLMEISFVLLVMVGIIGGALAMASGVMGQSTVTQETQILTNLSGAVTRTKSANGFGTTANIMQAMDQMKLVPSNVSRTGTGTAMQLKNGWGGNITIKPTNGGGNFAVTYAQIPKGDCVQLVNTVKPGILQSIGTGQNATMNITDLTSTVVSNTLCQGGTNTVTWDSRIF